MTNVCANLSARPASRLRLATLAKFGGLAVGACVCLAALAGCASGRPDVPSAGWSVLSPRISIQIGGSHVEPLIQTRNDVGGDQQHTLPIEHRVEAGTDLEVPIK